jgi:hypothetical protein
MYFPVGGVPGRERPRQKGCGRPFPLVGRVAAFAGGQGALLGGDGERAISDKLLVEKRLWSGYLRIPQKCDDIV